MALVLAGLLAVFAASASALVTRPYRSQITKANNVPFAHPFGVTVDSSDDVWVSDAGTESLHTVSKFDPAGNYLAQNTGSGSWGGSIYIEGLAFSAKAGEVFVSDSNLDDLWGLLDASGAYSGKDLNLGLAGCCIIRVAADNSAGATGGDLYVSKGSGVVRIKASTGAADNFTAGSAAGTNELTGPFTSAGALAVDAAGHLFVAGTEAVYEFEPSGQFTGTEFREAEGSPLAGIGAVAVDPTDGHVLIVTASGEAVDEFSPAGAYLRRITKANGNQLQQIRGLAVGSTGTLYAADSIAHVVDVFGPLVTLPDVTSGEATVASTHTATLHGEVNPAGLPVSECFFEYDTTPYGPEEPPHGQSAPCEPPAAALGNANAPVPVEAQLAGLRAGATYHFRLVAANANGTNSESADHVFFTGAGVDSTGVSAVTATSATLEAELNPHGLPTTYHFEYDTVPYTEGGPAHGTQTPTASAGVGNADFPVSVPVQGLAPGTTYHLRAVAQNSLGTVEGPDRSFTTQGAISSLLLPDGRGWELVSPPDKGGVPLEGISAYGADIQAAADGSGLAYVAKGSIFPQAPGNRSFGDSQLLAHRSVSGWSTVDVTPAHESPQGLVSGHLSEYKLFSSDLAHAAVEPEGTTPLSPLATERTPYVRQPDGSYTPLVTAANVRPGTEFAGGQTFSELGPGVHFVVANPDLSATVLKSFMDLTEPSFESGGISSVYLWSAGALQLLSQVPAASAPVCGGGGPSCLPAAALGLISDVSSVKTAQARNAVSTDGNRVIFGTADNNSGSEVHLWLRDVARGETVRLDALQSGAEGGAGQPVFQTASADGSRVFFTDQSRLTTDSTAKPGGTGGGKSDLYECKIAVAEEHLACALTDLTANTNDPAEPADVLRAVIGTSEDGSSTYFIANGALVPGAVRGNCDTSGAARELSATNSCDLYLRREGETTLVAVLSNRDASDWGAYPAAFVELTARVSPNGRWLAFMSQRPLTGYDNRDAVSGERDEEVFLYDSQTGKLVCSSCNPTGARPTGFLEPSEGVGTIAPLVDRRGTWTGVPLAANVPGWTNTSTDVALYQSRYLSNSGRLFFNSSDALVPSDSNGTEDVYQYEPPQGPGQPASNNCSTTSSTYSPRSEGCVNLISSGTSGQESAFLDASESGNDVFFLTASKLAPTDVDGALDVYDAHVCTTELPCPSPPPPGPPACEGDACQSAVQAPNDPTPGSLTFSGPGNLTPALTPPVKPAVKKKPVRCAKGKTRNRHHKCVSKPKRKSKARKAKRANSKRGGHK